jgi:pimeloyl-ACP methyl ester carboxylesterase
VIVVLPGIMGSQLAAPDPGRSGALKMVWAPAPGALWRGVAGGGPRIQDFALPDGVGDDHPGDGVVPVGLVPDVHALPGLWTPVKGYTGLLTFLEKQGFRRVDGPGAPPGNLLPFPYDWRLSNRYNGQALARTVQPVLERWRAQGGPYREAKLVLVCHSMGGLVARWYLQQCGGAEVTRKLITFGTPWRGAAKALDQLVNGASEWLGPLRDGVSRFVASLPSAYQLLPEYACIDVGGQHLKTTETQLPGLDDRRIADAMAFHLDLQRAEAARPDRTRTTHMIVGTRQPTTTTIRIEGPRAVALAHFGPDVDHGDGTVPLAGAVGLGEPMDSPLVRRIADSHGNLHRNRAALDELAGILAAQPVRRRGPTGATLRVAAPDFLPVGAELQVAVDIDGGARHGLIIRVSNSSGRVVAARQPAVADGHARARFTGMAPGCYTVDVGGLQPGLVDPVSLTTVVWGEGC